MTTAWNRRLAEYSWISKQVDNVTSGYIKKEVKMKQLRWVRSHDEYKGTNKTAVEYRSLFSRCGAGARVSTCSPKPSTLGSELGTECLETTLPSPSTASQSQVERFPFWTPISRNRQRQRQGEPPLSCLVDYWIWIICADKITL